MIEFLKIFGILFLIFIGIIVFFFWLFPKIYLPIHDKKLRKIQAAFIPGITDIEYAYQTNEKEETAETFIPIEKNKSTTATGYTLIYPKSLMETKIQLPLIVWCNGTGCTMENYKASLISLASYGFIVAGCDDTNMGSGKALYEMALYMKELNNNEESLFYQHIDTENIGVAGHSQGACGAVNCVTKYPESNTLFKCLFTTSMPKLEMCVDSTQTKMAYWKYDVSKIRIPYFATTGTGFFDSMFVSPLASIKKNFEQVTDKVPTFMVRQRGANHDILNQYHGSGYVNAWFCYMLKNDMNAAQAFIGKEEIKHNTKRWINFRAK